MLRKYQFLKKLISSSHAFSSVLSFPKFSFPFHHRYSHPFSTTSNISQYKQDLNLLNNFSPKHKIYTSQIMDKYATHREDLSKLTSDDIQWMFSGLYHLSLAYINAGNKEKAYDCLFETDYIFRKLGIKDTIDVALNYYDMSSILKAQGKLKEARNYLTEIDRICKLFDNDPQAKSLAVQSWHTLAQIEGESLQQDEALKLYRTVLENINHINETAKPTFLVTTHKDMGQIYLSRNDVENMIKSWEDGFQAAQKYFGENAPIAFDFLSDLVRNLAVRGHDRRAEPYAENLIKMALKINPNPHDTVAIFYSMLGNIYISNKKFPQAASAYEESLKIFAKLPKDYSDALFDVYFHLAVAKDSFGLQQESSEFLIKAEQTLMKAHGESNLTAAHVYYRWAKDLMLYGISAVSQQFYYKALDLYKTLEPSNKARIFSIYSGLGQIDFAQQNYSKALEIWKEAEKYLDQNDHPNVQLTYFVLERVYFTLNNSEEREKCVQKLLKSCEITRDTTFVFTNYHTNGELQEKAEELQEALSCYEIAARVLEKGMIQDSAKAQNLLAKISQLKENFKSKDDISVEENLFAVNQYKALYNYEFIIK